MIAPEVAVETGCQNIPVREDSESLDGSISSFKLPANFQILSAIADKD